MSGKLYLKNLIPAIFVNLMGMLALALFLFANGNQFQTVLFMHRAVADNKYLLRQSNMTITIDDIENRVYTDDKWVRFILNQIIGNAIKYRTEQPVLHFSAIKTNDGIVLSVSDNGIGIPQSDLPRIFEKGFTGRNGRIGKNSTGIGLYLCKRLCDKLGIGLTVHSENKGTAIMLSFQLNDFVTGVQG